MVKALGFSYESQLVQAGVVNVTQLIGTFISIPLMDTVGRMPLVIFGAFGMVVSMVHTNDMSADCSTAVAFVS